MRRPKENVAVQLERIAESTVRVKVKVKVKVIRVKELRKAQERQKELWKKVKGKKFNRQNWFIQNHSHLSIFPALPSDDDFQPSARAKSQHSGKSKKGINSLYYD